MENERTENTFYLDLKHVHKYGSAKFQPNPLFSSQQTATESAVEEKKKNKKTSRQAHRGSRRGMGCPNKSRCSINIFGTVFGSFSSLSLQKTFLGQQKPKPAGLKHKYTHLHQLSTNEFNIFARPCLPVYPPCLKLNMSNTWYTYSKILLESYYYISIMSQTINSMPKMLFFYLSYIIDTHTCPPNQICQWVYLF